jgi:hypothetical protein
MALGRAQVPPARPTAPSQADFKKRELLLHRLSRLLQTASSINEKRFETTNDRE